MIIDEKQPNRDSVSAYRTGFEIFETQSMKDGNNKQYTQYLIRIEHYSLSWELEKRFSDFDHLRQQLLNQPRDDSDAIPPEFVPSLPSKLILVGGSMTQSVVEERKIKLVEFMNTLLEYHDKIKPNRHILAFLGALNTTMYSSPFTRSRRTVLLTSIALHCRPGDVVLFRCKNPLSQLQRSVTGSEWDHVGLVIPAPLMSSKYSGKKILIQPSFNGMRILESTGLGVTCYPLVQRLRAYEYYKCCDYIAVRSLFHDPINHNGGTGVDKDNDENGRGLKPGTLHWWTLLDKFLRSVEGKPYGFKVQDAFAGKTKGASSCCAWPMSNPKPGGGDVRQSAISSDEPMIVQRASLTSRPKSMNPMVDTSMSSSSSSVSSSSKGGTSSSAGGEGAAAAGSDSFFCSELVAAALMTVGVLPSDLNANYFWPGSFAEGGEVDEIAINSYKYGNEMLIDCREMEIADSSITPQQSKSQKSVSAFSSLLSEATIEAMLNGDRADSPKTSSDDAGAAAASAGKLGQDDDSIEIEYPLDGAGDRLSKQVNADAEDDEQEDDETDAAEQNFRDTAERKVHLAAPGATFVPSLF